MYLTVYYLKQIDETMKRQIIIDLLMLTALASQAQELTGTWVSVSVKGFCYEQGKRVELDDTRMTEASERYTVMTFSKRCRRLSPGGNGLCG